MKEPNVIPPGVRRPLFLGRCFQDRMSECRTKIVVRLKNQMRKVKVESVERTITQQTSKWDPKSLFWPKRSPKTSQKGPQMGPDSIRGYPPRPFREQVRKNDPPPGETVLQLAPKWIPKSVHWRLGGPFVLWFFASFVWLIFEWIFERFLGRF